MALVDRQLATLTALEQSLAGSLGALLESISLSMLSQFRQTHLPVAADRSAMAAILAELRLIWARAITASTEDFRAEFSDGFPPGQKADTASLLETFGLSFRPRAAQQILDTTQAQVRSLLAGGMAAGESADAVYVALLDRLPALSGIRALLITRTEVHAAAQFTAWQLARQSLIPLAKTWVTVHDERTRDFGEIGAISPFNHRTVDGQRVDLNEMFKIPRIIGGHELLMFPGDPRGSAGNVINCRCGQTYERA